eukprot:5457973-Amphidinium_carterae.1
MESNQQRNFIRRRQKVSFAACAMIKDADHCMKRRAHREQCERKQKSLRTGPNNTTSQCN